MNCEVKTWVATKLTGVSLKCRPTENYFCILKETEKAYLVSDLRSNDPIGWVAKSQVIRTFDDDTEVYNKAIENMRKEVEKDRVWLEKYKAKKCQEFSEWVDSKKKDFELIKLMENENTWIGFSADHFNGSIAFKFGMENLDKVLETIEKSFKNGSISLSSVRIELREKKDGIIYERYSVRG